MTNKVLGFVIVIVTVVWVINFYEDSVNPAYDGSSINGIMLIVVGGAFALRSGKKDDDDENGNEHEHKPKPRRQT